MCVCVGGCALAHVTEERERESPPAGVHSNTISWHIQLQAPKLRTGNSPSSRRHLLIGTTFLGKRHLPRRSNPSDHCSPHQTSGATPSHPPTYLSVCLSLCVCLPLSLSLSVSLCLSLSSCAPPQSDRAFSLVRGWPLCGRRKTSPYACRYESHKRVSINLTINESSINQ